MVVKKYLGMSGNALNWAIGAVAGCDFLLFGYGKAGCPDSVLLLSNQLTVM